MRAKSAALRRIASLCAARRGDIVRWIFCISGLVLAPERPPKTVATARAPVKGSGWGASDLVIVLLAATVRHMATATMQVAQSVLHTVTATHGLHMVVQVQQRVAATLVK